MKLLRMALSGVLFYATATIGAILPGAPALFVSPAFAQAPPCQWNYQNLPFNPDAPNTGRATATYCQDVQVLGNMTVAGTFPSPNPPTGTVVVYVGVNGSDANSGLTPSAPKQTLPGAVAALTSGGTIYFQDNGTYTLTASLTPYPNTDIVCQQGTRIVQGAGANVANLIDFNSRSAGNSSITNCTINDNRANNTDNAFASTIAIGAATKIRLVNNTISSSTGRAISLTTGSYAFIDHNRIDSFFAAGVELASGAANTPNNITITNNILTNSGLHCIRLSQTVNAYVAGNRCTGILIGAQVVAPTGPIVVSTSGTAVTWVSGPNFATAKGGLFMFCPGSGQAAEYAIQTVNSSTSITLASSAGTNASLNCSIGSGDLYAITNVGNSRFVGNYGSTVGSIVYSLGNGDGGNNMYNVIFTGNYAELAGEYGMSIQDVANGTTMSDMVFSGNVYWGTALLPTSVLGGGVPSSLTMFGPAGNVTAVTINGDMVIDPFGTSTYWLTTSQVAPILNSPYVAGATNGLVVSGTSSTNPPATLNTFSNLPTCVATLKGAIMTVSDSNTNTWGANIAGGGANLIQATCNGANWTVMGK